MRVLIVLFTLANFVTGCGNERNANKERISETKTASVNADVLFADNNDSLKNILINQAPVEYCNETHYHFVDKVAKVKVDSLLDAGVKDILYYRDWIGTNGFNGYGKLIWLQKEKYYQYQFNFENYDGRYGISSIDKSEKKDCDALDFYRDKQIDTVLSSPREPDYFGSHAADHFIYVNLSGKENCFHVSGLELNEDTTHLKSQLINKLMIPSREYFDLLEAKRKKKKL